MMVLLAACGPLGTPGSSAKPLIYAATSTGKSFDDITQFIYAMDASSGKVVWRVNSPGALISPLAVASNRVIAASNASAFQFAPAGAQLIAYDADTGRVSWQKTEDDTSYDAMVATGETVLLSSYTVSSLSIRALRATDGSMRWQMNPTVPLEIKGLLATSQTVFILEQVDTQAVATYAIEALRLSDGHPLWKYALNGWGYRLAADEKNVYVDETQRLTKPVTGRMVALNAADGSRRWAVNGLDGGVIYPAAAVGGVVYAQSNVYDAKERPISGQLLALRPADGHVLWSTPLQTLSQQINIPLAADDGKTAYVCTQSFDYFFAEETGATSAQVLAPAKADGTLRWTKTFSQDLLPPIVVGDRVYIGLGLPSGPQPAADPTAHGAIIALSAADGSIQWRVDTYGFAAWGLASRT